MPNTETKPIAEEAEKLVPVMSNASTPPVQATGMSMRMITRSSQLPTAR